MKKTLIAMALPLLCLATANTFAADTTTPDAAKTRGDVKAETRATSSSAMNRQNEASSAMAADSKTPVGDKSRAEVKAETRTAARAGTLPKAGEAVAAEQADGQTVPKKAGTKKVRHHMMRHHTKASSNTAAATNTSSGVSSANPASGPISAETKKPTN